MSLRFVDSPNESNNNILQSLQLPLPISLCGYLFSSIVKHSQLLQPKTCVQETVALTSYYQATRGKLEGGRHGTAVRTIAHTAV